MNKLLLGIILPICLFWSCKDDEDGRMYESPKVVGVLVKNVLKTPAIGTGNVATVVLPDGTDLSKQKIGLLVSNGELTDFENDLIRDVRKPLHVNINGDNGANENWIVKIQSPPLLTHFSIQGLSIPKTDVHFGKTTIIVQVPKGTDLTKLSVTMEFINGKSNFVNNVSTDYTNTQKVEVLGVDEETTYKYDLTITTEQIGPALIKEVKLNGIASDSVVVVDKEKNIVQPYFPYWTSFDKVNVVLGTGFGNVVDPAFVSKDVNVLNGFKVKVKGSDGVQREFTVKKPLVASKPILNISHETAMFASNAGSSAAFTSGKQIVLATHQVATGATITFGLHVYNLQGERVGELSRTGTNFDGGAVTGIRKIASDSKGAVLGVQLGAGAGAATQLAIYKWDTPSSAPVKFITYDQASVGLAYGLRSGGINIYGDLSANATIVVPMAQKADVLVWTVKDGVVDQKPKVMSFPYTGTGYYYSIEPTETGFIGAATGTNFNGLTLLNSTMSEVLKVTGITTTDLRTIKYKGRTLTAYTAFVAGKGHALRIIDVTDGDQKSLSEPIMNILTGRNITNGNNTVDADFAVIDNKLHVLFYGTNDGLYVYKLEE